MRLAVTGGRHFTDRDAVYRALDRVREEDGPIDELIYGDARGADRLCRDWADYEGITATPFAAEWDDVEGLPKEQIRYHANGKPYNVLAGHERNQRMIDSVPDMLLAFPGGSGTSDMCRRARESGIIIKRSDINGDVR